MSISRRDGDLAIGSWHQLPSPDIVELAGLAGFDFVVIDAEHGQIGPGTLAPMLRAADAASTPAFVRVTGADVAVEAGLALDAGAAGVIVPRVNGAAGAKAAVAACRFSPEGERSASPGVRGWWRRSGSWDDYARAANADVMVGVMVESTAALGDADAILTTPGLDLAFIGPMDLSSALGCPGELDHPVLLDAIGRIAAVARDNSLRLGVWAPDPAVAKPWVERGVDTVALSSDALILHRAWRDLAEDARQLGGLS